LELDPRLDPRLQPTTIDAFTVVQSLSWDVGSGLNQAIKKPPQEGGD